jgi:hypothetical protein
LARISVALNLPENKRELFSELLGGRLTTQMECNKGNTEHMAECFSVLRDNIIVLYLTFLGLKCEEHM